MTERFHAWPIPVTQLTRIPATNDQKRFYGFDPIRASEDCGTLPTQGFRASQNSVNDCRMTAGAKVKVRVPNNARPTAGNIEDADRNMPVNGGKVPHATTVKARRNVKAGKRAAKREAAKRADARRMEAIRAELRHRGYNV